ncbi:MAG: ABC transporter substrate-binding protein, partial [Chloroflexota bacterium]|nr:ABC transporter substrate-binding protein [Chloroflexota bacterium]
RGEAAHSDMHQEKTYLIQHPLAPIYNRLLHNDPLDYTKIILDLAERWEISADGKTYTFYLRKGVKFHDGTPLTSADAKASFERQIWPPKGILSPRRDAFLSVEKIETPDDYTVRFLLKFPQASFLEMVAMPFSWIFPRHILAAKGDMKKDINGTGPFKLKSYIRGVSYEYERNPDYFLKDRPYLDGIMRYIITDVSAVHSALRTRRILWLGEILHEIYGPDRDRLIKESPGLVAQLQPSTTMAYFFPNHKRQPWSDVRVRKAVDLATERQAFIKVIMQGDSVVGGYMVPGPWAIPQEELLKMPGYRPEKEADIAEAKRLLSEAGYPQGFKTTAITRSDLKFIYDSAILMKNQLARIGIDMTVQILEPGSFYARQAAADFDSDSHGMTSATPEPDVTFGEQYTTTAGANWGKYSNPKIDELFEKQMQTMDPAQRKKILLEMQRILMDDYPRVAYFWRMGSTLFWPEVKGFVLGPNHYYGMRFQDVWLSQ